MNFLDTFRKAFAIDMVENAPKLLFRIFREIGFFQNHSGICLTMN